MKRVLTMQDISCFGKCSTTIALPLISAMGVETVILPTALLSAHTIFKDFTFTDLTDCLVPITNHWKKEGLHFDAIYTGYLGSLEEISIARQIFQDFVDEDTLLFIDPVMGDHGRLYTGFDEEYVAANTGLCACADVIVPNVTEACLMTGVEYRTHYDENYVKLLLQKLTDLGAKVAVLTGIGLTDDTNGVYGYDTRNSEYFSYQNEHIDAIFHGTGDIFSSVTVGGLMRGLPLRDAFGLAADYTVETIRTTMKSPNKPWYGVEFEATIPYLIDQLAKRCKN